MKYIFKLCCLISFISSGMSHADQACYQINNPEKDIENAISHCKKMIKNGDQKAEVELAALYLQSNHYTQAKKALDSLAKKGNIEGYQMLGVMYEHGLGVEKDYSLAMKWYLKGHESGNIDSTYNVGMFYIFGRGVEKSQAKGVEHLTLAAKKGHQKAIHNLGYAYEKGYGVEKNIVKAIFWYKKGSDESSKKALVRLEQIK